jgi:uncharacterized DUF497 family protein
MNISFEWDETKAQANLKNHHVSFEIAARVFLDPLALTHQDRIENGEYRWQTLGVVEGCLLLLVAHTVRHDDNTEIIRIISARKADRKERKNYEENR